MLKLLSLRFKAIRSFVSEQTISFVGRDKLIQVDGKNENTGGSSGAGKTSIFLALDYLLGINDIPATILQSRLTKEPIEVTGEFLIDDIPVTITRSPKIGLTIQTQGKTISGNVKLAEEKLDEMIGIPRKILRKMIHKKQKEGGFFLNMTAKDTYGFFTSILGLDQHIFKTDAISDDIKIKLKGVEECVVKIDLNKNSMTDLISVLRSKVKPTCTTSVSEIEKIKLFKDKIEDGAIKARKKLDEALDMTPPPSKIPLGDDSLISICAELVELQVREGEIDGNSKLVFERHLEFSKELDLIQTVLLNEAKEIGLKIKSLKNREQHLKEATCPTCKQTWIGEDVDVEIVNINKEVESLTIHVLNIKTRIEQKPLLRSNIVKLEAARRDFDSEIRDIRDRREKLKIEEATMKEKENNIYFKAQAEHRSKVVDIENKYNPILNAAREKLIDVEKNLLVKESELRSYNEQMKIFKEESLSLKESIQGKKHIMDSEELLRIELLRKISIAEEAKRLIKSYIVTTFHETLDSIGEMATDILSAIPNMSNSTIYFDSCKETKSGNIKDEVNVIINMNGTNAVPVKSLSGGERTAIDLAIDLAIIDTIETKVGKGADFFVIDEPFDGLDTVCKENCLEILRQVDTNKKIIMVDHSSELKEMVSDVIMVVKSGESSTIV